MCWSRKRKQTVTGRPPFPQWEAIAASATGVDHFRTLNNVVWNQVRRSKQSLARNRFRSRKWQQCCWAGKLLTTV